MDQRLWGPLPPEDLIGTKSEASGCPALTPTSQAFLPLPAPTPRGTHRVFLISRPLSKSCPLPGGPSSVFKGSHGPPHSQSPPHPLRCPGTSGYHGLQAPLRLSGGTWQGTLVSAVCTASG